MADETPIVASVETAAVPAVEPVAAPVAEAAAPAAETPVEVAPVVEAPVEAPAETSTIETAAEPVVEAEIKAEPKAEEAVPEPVALPTYEAFKLPEGFTAAPETLEAFSGTIGKMGLSQEQGQELMDLHGATMKAAVDKISQDQQASFDKMRQGWVQDFDKQAGNRRDTILNDAKWAISHVIPNAEARKAVWSALALTGAGDHPAVINAFAAAAKKMRERGAPPPNVPGERTPQNPYDKRYGASARS